jgi:murein L,D-transpeptidase YafK
LFGRIKILHLLALTLTLTGLVGLLAKPMVSKIVVGKSTRTLTLYSRDGDVVKQYNIILGGNPFGPKQREGDRRTPEGAYYVCFKNPQSRFHLSLGLSYPNLIDARQGLTQGAISQEEYRQIAQAQRYKQIPPWQTVLGGEIFIHGGKEVREATAGCVAVRDKDIEEIFPLVELGTPVIIEP